MYSNDFFQCPGTELFIQSPPAEAMTDSLMRCQLLFSKMAAQPSVPPAFPPEPPPAEAEERSVLDWVPTDWMGVLWDQWWSENHWASVVVVGCIGLVVLGFLLADAKRLKTSIQREEAAITAFFGTLVATAAVGLLWPLLLIILPFAVAAGCLVQAGFLIDRKIKGPREVAASD